MKLSFGIFELKIDELTGAKVLHLVNECDTEGEAVAQIADEAKGSKVVLPIRSF